MHNGLYNVAGRWDEGIALTPKDSGPSLRPAFHLWMEDGKKEVVLDQTDAFILRRVAETRSLTEARKRWGFPTGTHGTD